MALSCTSRPQAREQRDIGHWLVWDTTTSPTLSGHTSCPVRSSVLLQNLSPLAGPHIRICPGLQGRSWASCFFAGGVAGPEGARVNLMTRTLGARSILPFPRQSCQTILQSEFNSSCSLMNLNVSRRVQPRLAYLAVQRSHLNAQPAKPAKSHGSAGPLVGMDVLACLVATAPAMYIPAIQVQAQSALLLRAQSPAMGP